MKTDLIYLDYAAATPVSPEVMAAMRPYFCDKFYNPSAIYLAAKDVKSDLEVARANIANALGCKPLEITFTAGGTEANNLAISGVMQAYPGKKAIVSSVEHDSVLGPAAQYNHELAEVDPGGGVDLDKLEKLIDDGTVLVSVMLANNEVGTIQPVKKLTALASQIRQQRQKAGNDLPLYVHTDACQAGLYLDLHVARLGVDMMTLNGGKIYGPKQSGLLYIKSGTMFKPQIVGGGQERNRRSGTENVAFAVGIAKALELAQYGRSNESRRLQQLQRQFMTDIKAKLPAAIINGSLKNRLPSNIHLTLPGSDNERLLFALDERGVLAAAGSACSASNEEPSHVLRAMGVSEKDAQSSLRLSLGRSSNQAIVARAISILSEVAAT